MWIVVDSTMLGPALGGCRWKPYADGAAAERDCRDLAAAMTRKAALARLALGGGKAVVRGSPQTRTREQLLAFGEFVETLGGDYITGADMGTGAEQMLVIAERTCHVLGLPPSAGGCGDPGPFTAEGVFLAVDSALRFRELHLEGARVAVQGVGNVGAELVVRLLEAGCHVMAADPSADACARLPGDVEVVAPEEIATLDCEVFAPCGPPRVIDVETAKALRCAVVCGAANNPLASAEVAQLLRERGILYAPDFLVNAGGLIHLACARDGGSKADSHEQLRVIPRNLAEVLGRSQRENLEPGRVAELLASELVAAARHPDDLG